VRDNFSNIKTEIEAANKSISNPFEGEKVLTNFWDTNFWNGAADSVEQTISRSIGLAEYTNANFVSNNTIFKEEGDDKEHSFPYPARESIAGADYPDQINVQIYDVLKRDGKLDKGVYIKKDKSGEIIDHFLAPRYVPYGADYPSERLDIKFKLDNECFKEYATKLIPRAVGYSASLIDYFFRGSMEITPPDQFVYAVIDGGIVDPDNSYVVENGTIVDTQVFTKIKAKVRNISPFEKDAEGNPLTYETIGAGNLIAVARYKRRNDYLPDLANDPPQADSRESIYSYSVSAPVSITSLVTATAQEYPFDFSENPIPASITDLTLQVVFRGILGDEQDGIAVGMVDLNEPQHLTFWNDTDYFLLNGVPVKAEDSNDPYVTDPYSLSEDLGFSAEDTNIDPPVIATINSLPPGRYSRLIVLTDSDPTYYATNRVYTLPGNPVSVDYTVKYSMPIVINQKQIDGTWLFTPVSSVRGISQHFRWNHIDHYPIFEYVDTLPAPTENELGAYPVTISSP
jgi:hypothetical protein